jgi:site-specific DNA recombinase
LRESARILINACMTFAIGYIRVSTLQQVHEGESLQAQRDKIGGWCAYASITLRAIEEDAGISGASTDNRPGFKRAIRAALEGGEGAVLVVKKFDRLGRNAIDVQETLAVLLDSGVRVVSLDDGVDSASGMGAALLKLLTNILATFAELEKETIVSRLQEGRRRAKEQKRAYTREVAYGLRREIASPMTLVNDEGELAAVERIRVLRAEGLTIRAICAQLDREGVKPRRAATWSPAVVLRLATGRRPPAKKKASARLTRARAELLGTL